MLKLILVTILLISIILVEAADNNNNNIIILSKDNFNKVVEDYTKTVLVSFTKANCNHCLLLGDTYRLLADTVSSSTSSKDIIISNIDCDENKEICEKYEIKSYPTLKIFNKLNEQREFKGTRRLNELLKFVNEASGTDIMVKSNVVVLNNDNFDKIVMDNSKDVFVKFYAPWSGHCKVLMPTIELLANALKDKPDIIISNLDGYEYDSIKNRFKIQAYPTLLLFSKDNKQNPIEYNERNMTISRTVNSLIKFINDYSGGSNTIKTI